MTEQPGRRRARLVLVTGKGGVGKTTIAAATAVRCAALGHSTCVASTDVAHSLGDVVGSEIASMPTGIADRLHAVHLDARHQLSESWGGLHEYLKGLVADAGLSDVQAAELAMIPGFDELLMLAAVVDLAESGRFDVVVVDCAPSAETIRLLSVPHVLGWWLRRLLPQIPDLGPLIPLVESGLGVRLPSRDSLTAGRVLIDRLEAASAVLGDRGRTLVRLVTTAEPVVTAETRRTAAYLALFDHHLDVVVANRLLPDAGDPWLAEWRAQQVAELERLDADLAPVPVMRVESLSRPAVGLDSLETVGLALYRNRDPSIAVSQERPIRYTGEGKRTLRVPLPGLGGENVSVGRERRDLLIRVGPHRRVLTLPDVLASVPVRRAQVDGDELAVEFDVEDPLGENTTEDRGDAA